MRNYSQILYIRFILIIIASILARLGRDDWEGRGKASFVYGFPGQGSRQARFLSVLLLCSHSPAPNLNDHTDGGSTRAPRGLDRIWDFIFPSPGLNFVQKCRAWITCGFCRTGTSLPKHTRHSPGPDNSTHRQTVLRSFQGLASPCSGSTSAVEKRENMASPRFSAATT